MKGPPPLPAEVLLSTPIRFRRHRDLTEAPEAWTLASGPDREGRATRLAVERDSTQIYLERQGRPLLSFRLADLIDALLIAADGDDPRRGRAG